MAGAQQPITEKTTYTHTLAHFIKKKKRIERAREL